LIKTTAGQFASVEKAIRELHSYEVPECLCLTVEGGGQKYLDWIGDCVK
jgi:periplasmic divalent cation tolerance protein